MNGIIKPLGRLFSIDANGFLINDTDVSLIKSPFLEAVEDAVQCYRDFFGDNLHSVYVRGSVARGTAIADASDLDCFIVTHHGTLSSEEQQKLNELTTEQVDKKHPYVDGVENVVLPLNQVLDTSTFNSWAFLLKTQSACVHGQDVRTQLPDFRCDRDLARSQLFRAEIVTRMLDDLREVQADEQETKNFCHWLMKIFVRSGLALVMVQEQVYTRDLYPAYEVFCRHFPEKKADMTQALELAIEPTGDADRVAEFVDTFGGWLAKRAEAWMERY